MILVTVADDRSGRKEGKYGETQDYIEDLFRAHPEFGIDKYLMWNWDDIKSSRYYNIYKDQLDLEDAELSGRLYKPLLIKEGLDMIEDGEFLIYNDTSIELWKGLDGLDWSKYSSDVLKELCLRNGGILTSHVEFNYDNEAGYVGIGYPDNRHYYDVPGHHTHETFTRSACMDIMDPDRKYLHCLQHASGFIVIQKNEKSIKFINDWINYNTIYDCHTAVVGEPHRTDQSISGMLINRLSNKLVYSLLGYDQFKVINPYNLLSFSQVETDYKFIDSIQPKQEKRIKMVAVLEREPTTKIVKRWRVVKRNEKQIMKLHLGSAEKKIEGYINVDVRDLPGVDIVEDITILSSIEHESADVIYVSHVLEHVTRPTYMDVLKRWHKILKPGGILRIAVPDFEAVVEHYVEHKDLTLLRGFLYGGQTYKENFHYCAWDFEQLSSDLKEVGFKEVARYDWRETEHSHVDDFSQCYLPHMDKENGKLMSLNIEAIK
jgi:SAM-dependent methyltransferase